MSLIILSLQALQLLIQNLRKEFSIIWLDIIQIAAIYGFVQQANAPKDSYTGLVIGALAYKKGVHMVFELDHENTLEDLNCKYFFASQQ